jgi:hypothetical protein
MEAATQMDKPIAEKPVLQDEILGIVGFYRFVAILFGGLALVYSVMLLVVLAVPDGNDYAAIGPVKQHRLATLEGQRIVLAGGSNLAYGADSLLLEQLTGCPAVNMGMNGFFGVEYILKEAAAGARAGDLIVIAFEWDNFFKGTEGGAPELLMALKTNPTTISNLSWSQFLRAATEGLGVAVRRKVLRLFSDGVRDAADVAGVRERESDGTADLMRRIESFAGFNAQGDLVSHVDVQWPNTRDPGRITDRINPAVIPMIVDYARQMAARDISVMISFTPLARFSYEQHHEIVDQAYGLLKDALPGRVPAAPSAYVYDDELFFDTNYHLGGVGREQRTRDLAEDILSFDQWRCEASGQ